MKHLTLLFLFALAAPSAWALNRTITYHNNRDQPVTSAPGGLYAGGGWHQAGSQAVGAGAYVSIPAHGTGVYVNTTGSALHVCPGRREQRRRRQASDG
jgi:hypothetical protein